MTFDLNLNACKFLFLKKIYIHTISYDNTFLLITFDFPISIQYVFKLELFFYLKMQELKESQRHDC